MPHQVIRVALQGKHVVRNTGGNHTYATILHQHLTASPEIAVRLFGDDDRPDRVRRALGELRDGLAAPRLRDDVVHYTGDTGPLLGARHAALVTTIHGVASLHVPGVRSPRAERTWRARVRRAAQLSDVIVSDSRSSVGDVARLCGIREDRIVPIHLGLDHERFNTEVPELEPDRRPVPGPFVLYVGNLEPRKNIPAMISGFERSELCRAGWTLVIAGRPAWDAEASLAAIEGSSSGRITYLGPIEHELVAPLMRTADGFVFPSLYEGFGLPPLEAAACGAPVVASSRGSLAEVLDGSAIEVDPLDVDSIAAGLDRLLDDDDRARTIERGLRNAARFRWERTVEEHIALYRQAAA